jgi:HPt (histidine-containing phosphotransfer) domain-containing protein
VPGTLRRLGISFDTLQSLLLRFADSQPQTLEELRAAVAAGDSGAVQRLAHALTGAAGNLGAEELREAARALELAARDRQPNLPDLLPEVERQAEVVFRSIESLRPEVRQGDKETGRQGESSHLPLSSSPSLLVSLSASLDRLRRALADFDLSGSAAALREIIQLNLPAGLRQQALRLQDLIDGYEYDLAGELVKQLLASLPEEPRA